MTITATFEDGVLKPAQPLNLPEHAQVRITIEPGLEPVKSDIQKEWDAKKEERMAALESLFRMAKVHSGEHMTREELNERR